MPLSSNPIEVELESGALCNFISASIKLSAEDTNNSASFELFAETDPLTFAYPDLKKGVKCKVYTFGKLQITGEVEKVTRNVETLVVSFDVASKGKKAKKTMAKIATGELKGVKTTDLITEISKNSGLEVEFGEIEDDLITRHVCIGTTYCDRELKGITRDRGLHIHERPDGKLHVSSNGFDGEGCEIRQDGGFYGFSVADGNEKSSQKQKTIGSRALSNETDHNSGFIPQQGAKSELDDEGEFIWWSEGDQTPESLKRHSKYDTNRRAAADVEVTFKSHGLLAPDGEPWVLRRKHHVWIPFSGIDDDMTVKSAELTLESEKMEASIVMAPLKGLTADLKKKSKGKAKVNDVGEDE